MKPVFILVLSFMMLSHAPARDSRATTEPPSLPENEAQVFTLPNGLTLIVEEDRSAPVASVQAWCGTGSIHEGKWLGAGLSHILEHMLFKGTKTRGGGEIAKQVQDRGGYINAYTSFDRTVYWIDVPSDGASEAVEILADAMMNSTLPEEEYVKEQEVIRREFAMGFDDPRRQSSQLMLSTVFSESPFRHPVIGYLDVYNQLTRDDVMEYYKARYAPNNLTFVVVGDVEAQKIRAQLEEAFKNEPRRALDPVFVAGEPEQVGRREMHKEFPTELSRLSLSWRVPGQAHPDIPALDLLGSVLGSGRSSLLNQQIREKRNLAHQIDAGVFSLQTDGVFIIDAVSDPDKRAAVETEALAILEAVKTQGVSQADLDKARRSMLAGQIKSLGTMRGKASDLGSNWLMAKNLDLSRAYLDAVGRVTTDDLQRVARQYLTPDRINVTSLNPVGSLSARAEARPEAETSDVKKFTLSNGLRLLVRENAKLPVVSITASFRGGLLVETPETSGITRLFSRTLLKGTKTRTAAEIVGQIESAGGGIGSESGYNSFNVAVEVMKPDLTLGLDILADVLKNPTFPEAEVALEKKSQLAAIKAEEEQITAVARNVAREKLFGTHPYALRTLGMPGALEKIGPKELEAFRKKYLVAKNGVIAVFGDVKAEDVLKKVEAHFSALPDGELAVTAPPSPAPLEGPVETVEERDKQQAVVMVAYPGLDVLSPDRDVIELIGEASNDLGSRFFDRIREKMGLAYFVGAGNFTGLAPGSFVFYLGTDPKKVEQVTAEFSDEIGKLAREGLTEEELTRAKKKFLGSEAIRNQSNSAFAATVSLDELMGLGYDHHLKRREQIEAVTLEDTKRVTNKFFNTPNRVLVTVRPPEPPAGS